MPLLRFDVIEGRSKEELKKLLDTCHEAMVDAFGVPERDRYQIVHQHRPEQLYAQIAERIEKECGVAKTDVMISIVENGDADWSFGMGEAQFIRGLL